MTNLQNIFSIKNNKCHKVITLLGIKFKLRSKYLTIRREYSKIENEHLAIKEECFSIKSSLDNLLGFNKNLNDKTESNTKALDYITSVVNCINKPILYNRNMWETPYLDKFYKDTLNLELKTLYQNLIKNLDDKSIEAVNKVLARTQKICTSCENYIDVFLKKEMENIAERQKESYDNIFKINDNCWGYNKYLLPINHFEMCVFMDKHYIDLLNIDYFKNKDIIDAGAFIGDSAIIFADYTNKNVYSFEPTNKNFELLQKTIELNNKNNIVAINKAVGDKNCDIELYTNSSASGILNVKETKDKEICKMITLDEYVKENNLEVGLIKTDLEGAEQMFLKGAENTIKTQRPTLLISIYHTASDFFNIKPLIDSWDLNYNFKIVKPLDGQILLETMLICEPKEIIND